MANAQSGTVVLSSITSSQHQRHNFIVGWGRTHLQRHYGQDQERAKMGSEAMPSRITTFRIVAVIMLLLTGVELVACEAFSPATCEISGAPSDQSTDSGDACLCCCFHIVVATPFVLEPTEKIVALELVTPVPFPSQESAKIYHPPKA